MGSPVLFAELKQIPMPYDISIVIPQYNEAESLPELLAWIDRVVVAQGWKAEVIVVDDGSTDGSWAVIQSLAGSSTVTLRGIRFAGDGLCGNPRKCGIHNGCRPAGFAR